MRKRSVNDPLFNAQWHLDNTGQKGATPKQDVRALAAWKQVGGGDRSIVIAIIDDGIDLDHPDLARNIWRNPNARARDKHGRDFMDDADLYNPRPKVFNPPFDDTDNNDIHGTPCAGVAAAVGNNRRGGAGMAWNCRLMAVKILAGPDLAPNDRIDAARGGYKKGCSPKYGFGRVNADAAVAAALRSTRRRSRSAGKKR